MMPSTTPEDGVAVQRGGRIDRDHAPLLHRADLIPARPFGKVRQLLLRHDDDIGVVAYDVLRIQPREGAQVRRHDVARAESGKHLADEGAGSRRIRCAIHLDVDGRAWAVPVRARCLTYGMHIAIDFLVERRRLLGQSLDIVGARPTQ